MTARDVRHLLRCVTRLRESEVHDFSARDLILEAGLNCSVRTLTRSLNAAGLFKLVARRKGLLNPLIKADRLKWARHARTLPLEHWTRDISFYVDAVSFIHHAQPMERANEFSHYTWRRKGEGLKYSARRATLPGSRRVKLIVAISFGVGVVTCVEYDVMNAQQYTNFVNDHFPTMFDVALKDGAAMKRFVHDNCRSQNSASARGAWIAQGCELYSIPSRSPDCNPIENFFGRVKKMLFDEAVRLRLLKESFADFEVRVRRTILDACHKPYIDNLISSMPRRAAAIYSVQGGKTEY